MENDLTNIDCRKSNFNRLTQFIPEPLRAWLAAKFSIGMIPKEVIAIGNNKYLIRYENRPHQIITVKESDYWDKLESIAVRELDELTLPIQPK